MSHLPFTLVAYFLNSISILIAKFLLNKSIPDPLIYIFFISAFSLVALLLLPFTAILPLWVFFLASCSTLLWTGGAYCMFYGLKYGQASRVIPVIGTLIPVFLVIYGNFMGVIGYNESWAVIILILGLIFLTLPYLKGGIILKEIIFILVSAFLFAYSYILLREAYLLADFFSVFVWSRLILIPVGFAILIIPPLRRRVLTSHGPKLNFLSITGMLFLVGQAFGGISELLLTFSVSLANPAVVNSLQGTQYVFLLVFSLILSQRFPEVYKERFSNLAILGKIIGILLVALGLYTLAFIFPSDMKSKTNLGVTYSPKYALELGIDPETTYIRMLDDLKPKIIRLPLYWDELEKTKEGGFDSNYMRFYIAEAQARDIDLIVVVGVKQPRWPECHIPTWAKRLSRDVYEKEVLRLIKQEITAYSGFSAIKSWQVENEVMLPFGECPKPDQRRYEFLEEEIALVKSLDQRPVILTDSGELSTWYKIAKLSDIFGFSVYRWVWSPWFGHVKYPLPPVYYHIKANIIQFLIAGKKEFFVSELQNEPWLPKPVPLAKADVNEQLKYFSVEQFEDNIAYAKEIGFKDILVWGVEWWYFMEQRGHPEFVEMAKKLFKD